VIEDQLKSTPIPRGETIPIPVITTRRVMFGPLEF
jgi:hypothetical protein